MRIMEVSLLLVPYRLLKSPCLWGFFRFYAHFSPETSSTPAFEPEILGTDSDICVKGKTI